MCIRDRLSPVLTMRLLAEERQRRTDQLLLTSPVSLSGMVLGKAKIAATGTCVSGLEHTGDGVEVSVTVPEDGPVSYTHLQNDCWKAASAIWKGS